MIHALIDALLGAAAEGNIGILFPDSDPQYKNADSRELLRETVKRLSPRWKTVNVDATVVLQAPKLNPFIDEMRSRLAADLNLDTAAVSIKPKTHEKIGSVGRGEAVEAFVSVLIAPAE